MERQTRKRGREEEENKEAETKAKKQEHIGFEDCDIFNISDPFRPLGVFDFPWLKENPVSESDDWKLDDVFSCSLLDTGSTTVMDFPGDCLCQNPAIATDLPEEKLEEEPWPCGDVEIDGFDCIWSPVLNQPLTTTLSRGKVSNV